MANVLTCPKTEYIRSRPPVVGGFTKGHFSNVEEMISKQPYTTACYEVTKRSCHKHAYSSIMDTLLCTFARHTKFYCQAFYAGNATVDMAMYFSYGDWQAFSWILGHAVLLSSFLYERAATKKNRNLCCLQLLKELLFNSAYDYLKKSREDNIRSNYSQALRVLDFLQRTS